MSAFHSLVATLSNGKTFPLSALKGQIVLVVNTGCGFATQFEGLEALSKKWPGRVSVLGFPSADFANQEKLSDTEMESECKLNHGVTFPLMQKSHVNGAETNDVFKYLKSNASGFLGMSRITWNFAKFLVDGDGKVIHRYAPTTKPEELIDPIEKLLAGTPAPTPIIPSEEPASPVASAKSPEVGQT